MASQDHMLFYLHFLTCKMIKRANVCLSYVLEHPSKATLSSTNDFKS